MPQLTISEVARQVGLQASAIRYYERIGILLPAQRTSGQRRYDTTVLYRLAVIQRHVKSVSRSMKSDRLFFGFRNVTRACERWQKLSQRKLAELDGLMDGMKTMQRLLEKMMHNCRCQTLEQCGKGIFRNRFGDVTVKSPAVNYRRGR